MATLLLVALILLFIACGVPVAFALGATATVGIGTIEGHPIYVIPQSIFGGINYFPLLAIPFFVFAGELMNKTGITERLIKFACLLVGKAPAGLAHANVVASMFFGGITGSAPADTSAIGSILIPAMEKEGYPVDFSAAVTASSSTIGPIIPPSIIMVIYGATTGVSVGGLFAAGLVPGIMVGLAEMLVVLIMDRFHKFPRHVEGVTWRQAWRTLCGAIWPLGMPLIVVGGILGGVFTPTEAGAVAAMYALFVGFFILKTLDIRDLIPIFRRTALITSTVVLIIGIARILAWVFAVHQVPYHLSEAFMRVSAGPGMFLLLVNALYLVMGMFMDAGASVILLAPLLAPVAASLGIHPLHFGLVTVLNLTIGHGTPPLGLCLFVASNIADISVERISVAMIPFLVAEVGVLLIMTYVPFLVMYVPRILGYA